MVRVSTVLLGPLTTKTAAEDGQHRRCSHLVALPTNHLQPVSYFLSECPVKTVGWSSSRPREIRPDLQKTVAQARRLSVGMQDRRLEMRLSAVLPPPAAVAELNQSLCHLDRETIALCRLDERVALVVHLVAVAQIQTGYLAWLYRELVTASAFGNRFPAVLGSSPS